MKICLCGNIANNLYVMGTFMKRLGYDVFMIREPGDCFAFSQPLWQDVEITMNYKELMSSSWGLSEWLNIEKQKGYVPPEWLINPTSLDCKESTGKIRKSSFLYSIYEYFHPVWRKIAQYMRQADLLILGTPNAEIMGSFSGVPYIIWPSGQDIRIASDSEPRRKNISLKEWINRFFFNKLLRQAFENAVFVGSHNPMGIGSFKGAENLFLRDFKYFPFPLEAKYPISFNDKKKRLYELSVKLKFPLPNEKDSIVLFIPSRIDFFWKGIDRFLRAFLNLKARNFYLICSGWGIDRDKAINMVNDAGMNQYVHFIDVGLSKPLLLEMFGAVDLVIDQFSLGTYGTSAIEAMSVGTPVMMWIDNDVYKNQGFSPPPVLNAKREQEIEEILRNLLTGKIDILQKTSLRAYNWISEIHDYRKVLPQVIQWIKQDRGI